MNDRRRGMLLRLGGAVASGMLLAASRPPFDVGPLAAIALVPLFVAWRSARPGSTAGYAFVTGVVYHAVLCSWIWYFGAVAMVPFVAALAAYWAAAGAFVGWMRGYGIESPWLTAGVWVIADAAVARFPFGGLSWGELGYAWHDVAPARAVAGVGGLTLVTYLTVAANALLADLVRARGRRAIWRAEIGLAVVVAAVVAATTTRTAPPVVATLRVATLQGNDKNRDLTPAEVDARYLPRSHFELAARIADPVDLIVFPESSMDDDPRTDPFLRSRLTRLARRHDAWLLANATVDAPPDGRRVRNLNVLFGPDGTLAGEYAKRHLVPFGEHVYFRGVLEKLVPAIRRQVPRDYEPGDRPGLLTVAGIRIGSLICFESAFGDEVRPLVAHGAQVLVVSTNNRSYRRSANSAQHLAIGQMRAAETGRPVVQAAISGISAVIDADGVVLERTRLFDRAVVETTVGATGGETPYVRYGEWALGLSLAGVAGALAVASVRARRRRAVHSSAV